MNSLFVSLDKPQILEMLQAQISSLLKNDPTDFLFGTSAEDPVAIVDIQNPIQEDINATDAIHASSVLQTDPNHAPGSDSESSSE